MRALRLSTSRPRVGVIASTIAIGLALTTSSCTGAAREVAPVNETDPTKPAATQPSSALPRSVLSPAANGVANLGAQANAFPGDADISQPRPPSDENASKADQDRWVSGKITTTSGLSLQKVWWHATDYWSRESRPADSVGADGSTDFKVAGWEPGVIFSYQVVDPPESGSTTPRPSQFWIGAKYYSPFAGGANKWSCFIYDQDPRDGRAKATLLSPYVCAWSADDSNDPTPELTVHRARLVTDTEEASRYLSQNCSTDAPKGRCAFVNFGYDTTMGKPEPLGDRTFNESDDDADKKVGQSTGQSASNTFGVEASIEYSFWEAFKAALKTKYEHTWATSSTFSDETTVKMPPQSVAWMEYQPVMQISVGSWVIKTGSEVVVIADFGVIGPKTPSAGSEQHIYGCALSDYDRDRKRCKVVPKELRSAGR